MPTSVPQQQIRALVVEDSAPMRRSIVYALARHGGMVCVEAENGVDALSKFAAEPPFDVVVTDINMPLMDGFKLIQAIRSGAVRPKTPIVVISTETADHDRSHALQLGANVYLAKPVQAPQVLEAVRGVLNASPRTSSSS